MRQFIRTNLLGISLVLITLACILGLLSKERRVQAQSFSYCYGGGQCTTCEDTVDDFYCEPFFITDEVGNCGGGPSRCWYIETCQNRLDCDSMTNIGNCSTSGCTGVDPG